MVHADQTNICLPLFITAIKTTGSDQGSSNLVPAVRVAIILLVVAGVIGVVGVGVTYWHCKKNKPRKTGI